MLDHITFRVSNLAAASELYYGACVIEPHGNNV